ncbi:MAG TPA: hypothetical protein VMX55_08090 [candidate division Zixibacteria bacterium]|nr:hypothetical protein [candidate division Zixibacteria bacterium]
MSEKEEKKARVTIGEGSDEIPVEDLKELFKVIGEEIPDLITGLFKALYSAETADQYAKGIATIYKTLSEQGLPEEMVLRMVDKYADSINILGKALQNIDFDATKKKKKEED